MVKFNHLDHSGGGGHHSRNPRHLPASNIQGSGSKGSKKVIIPSVVKPKPPSSANELRQRDVGFSHNAPQRQEKKLNKPRSAPSGSSMRVQNRSPERKAALQLNPKSGSQFKLNLKSGSQSTKSSLPSRSPIKLHKKPTNSSRAKNELILRKSSSAHSSSRRAVESPASSSPALAQIPGRRASALSRNEKGSGRSEKGKEDERSQQARMVSSHGGSGSGSGGKKQPLRLVSKHESEEKRQARKEEEERLLLHRQKKKRERRERAKERERVARIERGEEVEGEGEEEEDQQEHAKKKRKLELRNKQQSEHGKQQQSQQQLQSSSSLSFSPHAKPSRSSVLSRDKRTSSGQIGTPMRRDAASTITSTLSATKGIKPTRVSGLLKGSSSIKGGVKGVKSNNNGTSSLQAASKAQSRVIQQSSRPNQTKTFYKMPSPTTMPQVRPFAPTGVTFKPLPKSMGVRVPPPRPGVPTPQPSTVPTMQRPAGHLFQQRPPMVANPTFYGAVHQMAQMGAHRPTHPTRPIHQHNPMHQQQLPVNPLQMQMRPGVAHHIQSNVPQKIMPKGQGQHMRPHHPVATTPVPHQFAPPPRPGAAVRPSSNHHQRPPVMGSSSGLTFPLHAQISQYAALRNQGRPAVGIVPPPPRAVGHRFPSQHGNPLLNNKGKGRK